jgi:hypothetical protein
LLKKGSTQVLKGLLGVLGFVGVYYGLKVEG